MSTKPTRAAKAQSRSDSIIALTPRGDDGRLQALITAEEIRS